MRRKYDLVQSVWLKLIQQMRSLGIGLNTIKELKDNLLEPKIDLSQLEPEILSKILTEIATKHDSPMSAEQLLLEMKENGPSIFKSAVLATVVYRKRLHCIVNKDGEYILYDSFKHKELQSKYSEFAEFVSQPYFCISIAEAYHSLVNEWSPKPFIQTISLLSDTELEILDYIRKKNVNSINIRYKDGKPDLLEIDERYNISIEQRFLDVIAKNGYQNITVKTRTGKIVHFENKILKKLNEGTK
jgi:DNA-binding transcriptional MerR regulator